MNSIALYPGSFDPITFGHLGILERATHMFSKVIVTVAVNNEKSAIFKGSEREQLIRECIKDKDWADKVEVKQFKGLLVDFAKKWKRIRW